MNEKQDKQKQNPQDLIQLLENQNRNEEIKTSKYSLSPYFPEYQSAFQICQNVQIETVYRTLQNDGVFFDREKIDAFEEEISICSINLSNQSSFCEMEVKVGAVRMTINILNVFQDKQNNEEECSSWFSMIQFIEFDGVKLVIKAIELPSKDQYRQFFNLIKQFAFAKIASILEIGPKTLNYFGFDIIKYNNMAEFCMQQCEKLTQIHESLYKQLLNELNILHSLKIVHGDIKPDNLAFSPSLNKGILIDFGLSRMINQPRGYLTDTSFFGTLAFCYDDMKKIYDNGSKGKADIYYNDLFGVRQSLKEISEKQKSLKSFSPNKDFQFEFPEIQQKKIAFYQMCVVKFYLFKENIEYFEDLIIKKKKKLNYINIMLSIYPQLAPSEKLRTLYNKIILSQSYVQNINKRNVPTVYKHNLEYFHYFHVPKDDQKRQFYENLSLFKMTFMYVMHSNQMVCNFSSAKRLLLHKDEIKSKDKEIYYLMYIRAVSLRSNYCRFNFQQKHNANLIFKETFTGIRIILINVTVSKEEFSMNLLEENLAFLIKYCIQEPFNPWKIQHFSQIVAEYFIIKDVKFQEIKSWIDKILQSQSLNMQQKLFMCLSLVNSLFWLQEKLNLLNLQIQRLFPFYKQEITKLKNKNIDIPNAIKLIIQFHELYIRLVDDKDVNSEVIEKVFAQLLQQQLNVPNHKNSLRDLYNSMKFIIFFQKNQYAQIIKYLKIEDEKPFKDDEITYFIFVRIKSYFFLLIYSQLRTFLQKFDEIVNNQLLSHRYFIKERLYLQFFYTKNIQNCHKIIDQIQLSFKFEDSHDLSILFGLVQFFRKAIQKRRMFFLLYSKNPIHAQINEMTTFLYKVQSILKKYDNYEVVTRLPNVQFVKWTIDLMLMKNHDLSLFQFKASNQTKHEIIQFLLRVKTFPHFKQEKIKQELQLYINTHIACIYFDQKRYGKAFRLFQLLYKDKIDLIFQDIHIFSLYLIALRSLLLAKGTNMHRQNVIFLYYKLKAAKYGIKYYLQNEGDSELIAFTLRYLVQQCKRQACEFIQMITKYVTEFPILENVKKLNFSVRRALFHIKELQHTPDESWKDIAVDIYKVDQYYANPYIGVVISEILRFRFDLFENKDLKSIISLLMKQIDFVHHKIKPLVKQILYCYNIKYKAKNDCQKLKLAIQIFQNQQLSSSIKIIHIIPKKKILSIEQKFYRILKDKAKKYYTLLQKHLTE